MKLRGLWLVGGFLLACARAHAEAQVIQLESALRLAGAKNIAIEITRERVREARSQLDQERRLLLPWLAPGIGYRRHDGNLQDIVGDVFDASKQSGTAALTLQAQVDLGDAGYRVLAARQAVAASEAQNESQQRATHLAVATAYTDLSRAAALVVTADEAVRISDRTLAQVREAVSAGIAFAGDAARVEVQRARTESARVAARQEVRVASARLAQLLRLPPGEELRPDLAEFLPVILVPTNQPLDALVAVALSTRPELRRADALTGVARARRDGVTKGPWIPTLGAQAAFGGLAGGRNSAFGDADDFQDYGVGVSWRIGPGGIGDRSRIRTADARLNIAKLEQEQLRDEVVREVVELHSRTDTASEQVQITTRTVTSARRLLDLTQARREFGVGAVLEAIEAEREFSRAQAEHLQTIAEHNRAQWMLWHATGMAVPTQARETLK